MEIIVQSFTVRKRFPLTISRGTATGNTNLWVKVQAEEVEGWGEATPFSIGQAHSLTTDQLHAELQAIVPQLTPLHPLERQKINRILEQISVSSATRAALDMALYDWLGKRTQLPLWQLWGLNLETIVPTSVTIGISSPEKARNRVKQWQNFLEARHFKVKLGSPEGIEADQAMFLAVQEMAPEAELTVDANGGWSFPDGLLMAEWLAERGVRHLEQPLPVGEEAQFPVLYERSPLPIFADESCWTSQDIPRLASCVHGINIKIMKSGGLTEARRMIAVAQALGLQVMFGCYSDSGLANSAIAQLTPFAHYIDLDSHLNLLDDPFQGATLQQGRLIPNQLPGLGVQLA
ncbi:dipeptide epimerase [Spirulina sp. CS-785/01]|uniref:dipeptide epimerase n=1 Tax=Spirulina sp. CS-785/01 TaxID=3021716 RepID=UPI00232BF321|nr:dipeptide epimerase [Spirulina sp. CS-785/01]MDB9315446.1 dipeptide epimerase [Spirulina sp. CS-785/01]